MKINKLIARPSSLAAALAVLAALLVQFAAPSAWAVNTVYTWTGTSSGNWNNSANWNPTTGNPSANTDTAAFASSSRIAISLGAAKTVNLITFAAGSPAYSITLGDGPTTSATAYNLTFQGTGGGITVDSGVANNIEIGVPSAVTVGSIVLLNSITVTHNGSANLTIDRPITGTLNLVKTGTGSGSLVLSGANTYSGTTTVNGGILNAGVAQSGTTSGPLGTSGNIVFGGGILQFSTASASWDPSARIASGTSSGAVSIDVNGKAVTFATGLTSSQSGGLTLSDTAGSGSLTLSAANAYTGDTTISAGTLKLSGAATLASTPNITIASGATFDVSAPTTALTLGSGQTLKASATGANTTGTIKVASSGSKNLTLGGTTTGLEFTAYGGGSTPPLTLAGTGGNLVLNSKPIKVTTTAALGAGPYTLIAHGGTATVSGTPGTLSTGGNNLAAGATGALSVNGSGDLILTLSYTVTFNNNTGSGTMTAQTGVYNTTAALTANSFTKTGYTFAGWNTAANGTGTAYAAGGNYTFTASTTLYAQWTISNYTVSYDLNGGTGTTPSTQNGNYNTSITVATGAGFSRSGYVFTGWNTVAGGSGTAAAAGGSYTIPANNSTLFAQWSVAVVPTKLVITAVPAGTTSAGNTFTVTAQAQDNSGNPGNVTSDTAISLVASGSGTLAGNTSTITSGSYSVTLTGVTYTKAEAITLTASTTSGMSLTTSAASSSFTVGPSAANAANSTAVASPASLAADGSTASTVTVTIQDAYNNLLGSGTNVSWTVTGTDNIVSPASAGTTSSGGVATFTVKSFKAESKTVTVNVGATVITNALQITFTAPATGNSFTWDPSHNKTGSDAAGTWDTSTTNWANSSADFAWPNNGNDNATFGTNAALSANCAITLGSPLTVSNLTFNTTGTSFQYTLGNEQTITLAGTPAISVAGAATISGTLAGTGFSKTGAGTLTLSGVNTLTGTVTVSTGTLSLGIVNPLDNASGITLATGTTLNPTVLSAILAAPITTAGTVTINAPAFNGNGDQTFKEFILNGAIGGTANVTFNSTLNVNTIQTVTLGAASTYSGTTLLDTIGGGNTASQIIVKLGANNALPTTTVVTIDGQPGTGSGRVAEINLNGFNQTLAGLQNTSRSLRAQRVVNSDVSAAATLTINNSVDYTFSGNLGSSTANFSVSSSTLPGSTSGNNFGLTKSGSATFTLSGVNTYTGSTTISGGTLALGANNRLSDTTAITLGAATLDAATYTDTVGTLDVTNTGTINLGSGGALAFAASNGKTWSGGTLAITGTFVSGASLRFGTTSSGLTSGQLSQISATGYDSLVLNATGYLIGLHTPSITGVTASQSISYGTATVTLIGTVSAGAVYPANGETVNVTINGNTQSATIADGAGGFSVSFPTATIPYSASPYTTTYAYAGNGTTLSSAANNTSTSLTITKATPTLSGVTNSQGIAYGTASVSLGGTVSAGAGYPANGETVNVTINGNTQPATIAGGAGSFSVSFPTAAIPYSGSPYTITYAYAGDANLNAAADDTTTSLTITKATSAFSGLTGSQSISYGTTSVTLGGTVSAGAGFPADGETVSISINGNNQSAPIAGGAGGFSVSFPTATLPPSNHNYTITYAYAGDANLNAATSDTSTHLTVTGVRVPNLTYTNAPGISRQISVADIQAAGLVSSQVSPTYSITLPSATSAQGGSVITNSGGTIILYTPSGTPSSDTFDYTVSDGTVSATATVTITFASVAGVQIDSALISNDGADHARFTFHGIPGTTYHVQRATTLGPPNWTNADAGVQTGADGSYLWTDTATITSLGGTVYYRISYP